MTSHVRRCCRMLAVGMTAALVVLANQWVLSPVEKAEAAGRPNIVLITTDDMAATDLRWMPETRDSCRTRVWRSPTS